MTTLFARSAALLLATTGIAASTAPPDRTVAAPPAQAAPATPAADLAAATRAANASNAFAVDLFRALRAENPDRNLFFSPYSVSVALTMAAEGARGETETEMAAALHFTDGARGSGRPITPIHTGNAALARRFAEASGSSDPKTRDQIAGLRAKLAAANALTRKLETENTWQEAMKAHQEASQLANELNGLMTTVDRFDLRIANALWVEQTFALAPTYSQAIEAFYGTGGVTPLNIAGDNEGSRLRINGWVEDHTERRIKDLIPQGALAPDSRLVITNAVYFLGQWVTPFAEHATADQQFTRADGTGVTARMMNDHARGGVPYAAFTGTGQYFDTPAMVPSDPAQRPATYPDDAGFSLIELPYKGGDLSMVLIAPRTPQGLPALESTLTAAALSGWLAQMKPRTVDTALPRFALQDSSELSGALQSMGMRRAFTSPGQPGGAQFTGMSAGSSPAEQLFISKVLHKAWVEVNEKGTEAAAATAVIMAPGSAVQQAPVMVPFVPVFHADHPFLFLIRDGKSGLILFVGRVAAPAQ